MAASSRKIPPQIGTTAKNDAAKRHAITHAMRSGAVDSDGVMEILDSWLDTSESLLDTMAQAVATIPRTI